MITIVGSNDARHVVQALGGKVLFSLHFFFGLTITTHIILVKGKLAITIIGPNNTRHV